jgi:hypothetical protein
MFYLWTVSASAGWSPPRHSIAGQRNGSAGEGLYSAVFNDTHDTVSGSEPTQKVQVPSMKSKAVVIIL